ncbi:ABC transporter ATP-binding protein [Microbacterium sp. LRZ72]|uniref:ABC transporter ATP-binding protein n=1 Tax=Microbacterium sp. LRZ72 TaxID=2942481 RepID=UPI0029B2E325|nr:ABC transporter ATP-binding protein [Microbacterium sp. LRZ72]MDX2376362.1 ABC transporter ATP-binding protein [Microbacterium sp. LRZ72]
MGQILIEGLEKTFNSTRVLHGLDLHIKEGEFVTLLGPSGCGKTTTLRCVAGLETPTSGRISIGPQKVVDTARAASVPAHKRRVGMVFQSYAIWPHMSALSNVTFPLKRHKQGTRAEQKAAAERALDAVGMSAYANRYPHELSGGQQQRIALARGLVAAGEVMLYDEPLSNLDAKLRVKMRDEVRRLHNEFEHTSIYVTHDQEEAFAISDRVVIMNGGRIEQAGTPREIFSAPSSRYVADFIGYENILEIDQVSPDGTSGSAGELQFTGLDGAQKGDAIAFRSGVLRTGPAADAAVVFEGTPTRHAYIGDETMLHLVTASGTDIVARIPVDQEVPVQPQTFNVARRDIVLLRA